MLELFSNKYMRKELYFLFICIVGSFAQQSFAGITVSQTYSASSFPLVSNTGTAALLYDSSDALVVGKAAQMLNDDIKAVTGKSINIITTRNSNEYLIIAGTLGQSNYIEELSNSGKLDVSSLNGKWESYQLKIVDNPYSNVSKALVVCGSTPRGTAYGILEISRLIGVSPYVWWADVAPDKQSNIYLNGDILQVNEPSVKYRGIFINDEDWGILPWAKNGIDAKYKNIGPNTYEKIAELMLRLRANTLWPAKHGASKAFWSLEENLKIAKEYGLIMSSGDPMLRDNLWEWPRFGGNSSNYNYATNKDMMYRYWAERVGQSKTFEAIYDISTRGFQDEPLLGYDTTADAVEGITGLIKDQRQLLEDSIGNVTSIPQIYLPYKEALDLYNAGLDIPDDVILCWVDDNFGHIRQLPNPHERKRSGGNGVYYHLSYLGTPASYLWLSSMSPAFLSYELSKGYEYGIDKFWMFNVGDIKPAEMELEFCMDLAWDIEAWNPLQAYLYSRHWAAKTFGETYADAIGNIKNEYYTLAANCKPELINRMDYPNDECNERIARYDRLCQQVDSLQSLIPSEKQDAFFELIGYPVKGAAAMNTKIIRAQQSWFYAAAGKRDTTLSFAAASSNGYQTIKDMTTQYNEVIANGKWNKMMDDSPYNGSVFDMPTVPTESDVYDVELPVESPSRIYYKAKDHISTQGSLVVANNLGVAGSSVITWPMNKKVYNTNTYKSAPALQFNVSVKKGINKIVVRCLPSFPVTTANYLRVGLVVDSEDFTAVSIKTKAMSGKWNTTVAQGFADATVLYESTENKDIPVSVYFMDPGLAISDLYVEHEDLHDDDLTDDLLVNADFEYNDENVHQSKTCVPYGWTMSASTTNGSYGINADAENPYKDYCFWAISRPFPDDWAIYQTIPAEKLQPGVYQVSCILWNQNGISGNCRLFANNNVQYFSSPDGVAKILTTGERNSYASYQGTTTSDATMKPMTVYVAIHEGDSLQVGIKTSNRKGNGTIATGNDPTGWFKADHFRIRKVAELSDIHSNISQPTQPLQQQKTNGIYNMLGQKVSDKESDIKSLPKGIYIVNGRKIINK